MVSLNIWSVIAASFAAFVVGSAWYSPLLFGNEWQDLMSQNSSSHSEGKKRGLWSGYIPQFIVTLVIFAVLGFIITNTNSATAIDGALMAFLAWLGFNATESVTNYLWQNKSIKLILIETVGSLLMLVVGGAILGAWA